MGIWLLRRPSKSDSLAILAAIRRACNNLPTLMAVVRIFAVAKMLMA